MFCVNILITVSCCYVLSVFKRYHSFYFQVEEGHEVEGVVEEMMGYTDMIMTILTFPKPQQGALQSEEVDAWIIMVLLYPVKMG